MGRVIRSEIVAIRCELRSCAVRSAIDPVPVRQEWVLQASQLQRLVDQGWGLVLTPQLRSYCPAHAERVWRCTCRTNPYRRHLCTVHCAEAAALVRPGAFPAPVDQLSLQRRAA